jgi:UDP-3-O-[3-hydroxymyristoyl] glucosamine N-acyltransferase
VPGATTAGETADRVTGARGGGEEHLTAAAVARVAGGTLASGGDADRVVRRMAPLDRAGPEDVSFLASARYVREFGATRAGVVLVAPELADTPGADGATRVVVDQPHEAMLRVLPRLYRAPARHPGVHSTAVVGRGVRLGDDVTIGAYAVIGDGAALGDRAWIEAHAVVGAGVAVGEDAHVFPHATLYPGTVLGARVTIHAGARIGSDGFGYVFGDGQHRKIPHVGRCIVEDDVEIGANTTVDRGSVDDTVVGAGSKIDNLVQIAHNVRIGRLCLLMSQVGIAGSATIGDGAILAGQAGIIGHSSVGAGARIGGQAGVIGDVPAGATFSGYPARPHRDAMRSYAAIARLAALVRPLERLLAKQGAAASRDGAA